MLIPNHPHDERLSMLASDDPEATADSELRSHVASCTRCTDTVAELSALRVHLAALPDLRPNRPLMLVPPVPGETRGSRADRLGGWARRFFAPVLATGAAVALVGLVGTVGPVVGPQAQSGGADSALEAAPEASAAADGAEEPTQFSQASDGGAGAGVLSGESERQDEDVADERFAQELPAERSLWPMILFTGVALMILAVLLRWVLEPRAG